MSGKVDLTCEVTIKVNDVNERPVVTPAQLSLLREDSHLLDSMASVSLKATDPDNGDSFTWTLVEDPSSFFQVVACLCL